MADPDFVPTITGLVPQQHFATGSTIDPFATVTIGDANPDAQIAVQISQSAETAPGTNSDASGDLTGAGVTVRKSGVYELTGTADQVTQQLQNLVFQPNQNDPAYVTPPEPLTTSFGLEIIDQTDGTAIAMSENSEITQDAYKPPGQFLVVNTTAGPAGFENGTPYTGPVAGIKTEFNDAHGAHPIVDPTKPDPSLNVTAYTPDVFVVTGNGMDGIDVGSHGGGNNILDGGGGSNFLTGGAGDDTFYVDARNPSGNVWSTVSGFHSGDAATIWGVTPQDFALTWLDGQGAAGHTGLTGVFVGYGQPEVGITLAGFSTADLTNGTLSVSYGKTGDLPGLPGSDYMHIAAV